MEVDRWNGDSVGDEEEEDEEGMDQTGFLLQRLQELKEWQANQEDRLRREQREQMERVLGQGKSH